MVVTHLIKETKVIIQTIGLDGTKYTQRYPRMSALPHSRPGYRVGTRFRRYPFQSQMDWVKWRLSNLTIANDDANGESWALQKTRMALPSEAPDKPDSRVVTRATMHFESLFYIYPTSIKIKRKFERTLEISWRVKNAGGRYAKHFDRPTVRVNSLNKHVTMASVLHRALQVLDDELMVQVDLRDMKEVVNSQGFVERNKYNAKIITLDGSPIPALTSYIPVTNDSESGDEYS